MPPVNSSRGIRASWKTNATAFVGTPRWMAPEMLEGKYGVATYGPAVDVYSFGIVMFEIGTGRDPYGERKENWLTLSNNIIEGLRPGIPADAGIIPAQYLELMSACWNGAPK